MSRYVSNADLARMQARYAHQERGVPMPDNDTVAEIKRRERDNAAARDLHAEIQEKARKAIDLAEAGLRRQRTLDSAAASRRNQDAKRARAVRS